MSRSLPGWRTVVIAGHGEGVWVGPGGQAAGDRELVLGRQWWVRVMLVSPVKPKLALMGYERYMV